MIRVASIWNKRPDLGEIQIQMVQKLADQPVEFIVGTIAQAELLDAIKAVTTRYGARLVNLEEGPYKANMAELVYLLDQEAEPQTKTFYVEEDIIPLKRFSWPGRNRASAYQGKSLRCWQGEHPELGFDWEPISHDRIFQRKNLPTWVRRTIKEKYVEQAEPGMEGARNPDGHYMEVFDGMWLHYDKAGYPRKGRINQTKDELFAEICKVYEINTPEKWYSESVPERDPDELAAHHAHADREFRMRGLR